MTMYEDSSSIPLIISGKDFKKNEICDTPVSLLDIYPTIFDIMSLDGIEVSPDIDGQSLINIGNNTYNKERCVLSEYHGAGAYGGAFMLRMGDYKYIYYVGHDCELFNVKDDPKEEVNLYNNVKFKSLIEALNKELRSIINPEDVDNMARQSQSKMLDEVGGKDFVLKRGNYAGTPVGS
jgi:choline-sulfatase